jgi:(2Fe-2S) ferredoxin
MPRPEIHVLICSQQRPPGHPRGSCGEKGAGGLLPAFSQAVITHNLLNKVSLVPTGCLGPCQAGASVLVFPGSVLYSNVTVGDVETIVQQHLIGGEPVAEKLAAADIW